MLIIRQLNIFTVLKPSQSHIELEKDQQSPTGLAFNEEGRLFSAANGADERGSRLRNLGSQIGHFQSYHSSIQTPNCLHFLPWFHILDLLK